MLSAIRRQPDLRRPGRQTARLAACSALLISMVAVILLVAARSGAWAAPSIMEMDIEDLMNLKVTSMSKRPQSLQDTAAAVYVLTSEDIRRSGATTVPDALRMVPGLMVAQNSASTWSVSSRGRSFNPSFEDKLLVMIDGRSIYSALFNNVFWEYVDLPMEDIDHIEVIRGPGSSTWGANAVNGIINIITKPAVETQGVMASAIYGTTEKGTGTLRYGGTFGEANAYRVYGKYRNIGPAPYLDGGYLHDGQEGGSAGFRTDLKPDGDSTLTLQGDVFQQRAYGSQSYPDLTELTLVKLDTTSDLFTGNVLTHYTRNLSTDSNISLQAYYTVNELDDDLQHMRYENLDLDFQHQFVPRKGHVAQWGLGYRLSGFSGEPFERSMEFSTDSYSANIYSAFLQDEISFADGEWVLTLGSKFEYSDIDGLEIMPSARLLWRATEEHAFWAAVSRTVRTPSVAEEDMLFHLAVDGTSYPVPLRYSLQGNTDMESQDFLVWELGHRFTPSARFFMDTALYLTQADHLYSVSYAGTPTLSADWSYLQLTTETKNDISGTIYGAEVSATWVALPWWKLRAWYSLCEESYRFHGDGIDALKETYGHTSPTHQFFLRSSMDLPHDTELDVMGRYVSELDGLDVPDYFTMDAQLSWRPTENLELSLVGRNLVEPRHVESASGLIYGSNGALERSCFMKLRLDF